MRVAQITFSGLGGSGAVALGLIKGDLHREWDWSMGFLGVEPLRPAYVVQCNDLRVPYKYIAATPGKPIRAWPAVYRWLCLQRPALAILHSPTAILPCFAYARRTGTKLIVVEHQPNALRSKGDWAASRLAMMLADAIVLLTEDYTEAYAANLRPFFFSKKTTVIPNGIDVGLFSPNDNHAATRGERLKLGMAARFQPTKRFDVLLNMSAELLRSLPTNSWQLSLAGSGETLTSTQNQSAEQGLNDLVTFEGGLDEHELANWYRGLDIYIHASDGETLSISVLQAMATGLPVIASDVAGLGPFLRSHGNAVGLVKEQTGEAFAASVLKIAADLCVARAASEAMRLTCVEKHSHRSMFISYRDLASRLTS